MIPTWLLASLCANVTINIIEYLNRTAGFTSALDAFKTTWWLIVLAQIGLYYAWRGAPSMMLAWACFTGVNAAMRLVSNHYFVGEPLNVTGWAGVSLMFAGMFLVKQASE